MIIRWVMVGGIKTAWCCHGCPVVMVKSTPDDGRLWHVADMSIGSMGPNTSEVALPDGINLAPEGVFEMC